MRNNLNVCVLNTLQFARQLANVVARNPSSRSSRCKTYSTYCFDEIHSKYFNKNISVDFIQNL